MQLCAHFQECVQTHNLQKTKLQEQFQGSLVPSPSHRLVVDGLQYAKTEGEGLVHLIPIKRTHFAHAFFILAVAFKIPALGAETTR